MPISSSPRKVVPLNSDDGPSRRSVPTHTKRAFFCGVVVEGPNDGADLTEDVQDLVASLGDRVPSDRDYEEPAPIPSSSTHTTRPRALTNTSALADLINELVVTERNYVQRLRMLKDSYADPLRSYARSKDTAIIAAYEAKILFGNIDQLLPANEAFLHDLELMGTPTGAQTVGGVGDIALHHFQKLKAFECYKQYYVKREEAQAIFKREMAKKSSTGFSSFVERIKYSTNDPKNRVGLRELLMEPVQRIPRYTLLFRSMIKLMGTSDPQRAKLVEADEVASRIALAETDSHTRLAATLNCLATSIEGFPPALISSSRRFIDCIDVVDNLSDAAGMNSSAGTSTIGGSGSVGSSGPGQTLQCTLFLFDDRLMIVKRPGTDKPGRTLAGLDDVERLASGGLVAGRGRGIPSMRRAGMSCKGVMDITDVNATDVSGTEMHLYLETPPLDQTDRWAGRPFRLLSTMLPGVTYADNARLEREKKRFLENLWRVQARYRTRQGQSVALCGDEQEVESRGGKTTVARAYFNVYQRTMFLQEARKTKVVLHIDSLGDADPLPFGMDGPPYVVIRVRPMPGELCRYSVHSQDPEEELDEDVVQSTRVPERVVQTIHQYGLFKFKTDNPSRPATPSGGNRSRAHIFGLDAISRNLFGSSRSRDVLGDGSLNKHRRSKSAVSRSSTLRTETTGTTMTAESSTRFSHRTNSTAATSVSSFDDGSVGKKSTASRKLVKRNRSRSPGTSLAGESEYASESEQGNESLTRRRARSMSSVPTREDSIEYSDHEDADTTMLDIRERGRVTESEMDLSMRLELARRNSQQHGKSASRETLEFPVEEVIYEEDPPPATRPTSRASRLAYSTIEFDHDDPNLRSSSPHRSITPTPISGFESPRKSRAESFTSATRERRPIGPRSSSTFIPTSPTVNSINLDIEGALESTLADMSPKRPRISEELLPEGEFDDEEIYSSTPVDDTPSRLPRSKRQPFAPLESTPKGKMASASEGRPTGIEPLSIKKKITGPTMPGPTSRRPIVKDSRLTKSSTKAPTQLQRSESVTSITDFESCMAEDDVELTQALIQVAASTREDLESSQRAIKRIKLEINAIPSKPSRDSPGPSGVDLRPSTPVRGFNRTPTRTNAAVYDPNRQRRGTWSANQYPQAKEAQARIEEMHALIGQRRGIVSPLTRPRSVIEGSLSSSQGSSSSSMDTGDIQGWAKNVEEAASMAEGELDRAMSNHAKVESGITELISVFDERSKKFDMTSFALRRSRRQNELLKDLLSNATAENEILYGSFNEELDGLFNEVTLPPDEAWIAMSTDLNETKKERFRFSRQNAQLQRQLREAELQRDEWAALLRHHGLIP